MFELENIIKKIFLHFIFFMNSTDDFMKRLVLTEYTTVYTYIS